MYFKYLSKSIFPITAFVRVINNCCLQSSWEKMRQLSRKEGIQQTIYCIICSHIRPLVWQNQTAKLSPLTSVWYIPANEADHGRQISLNANKAVTIHLSPAIVAYAFPKSFHSWKQYSWFSLHWNISIWRKENM